ncbi:MAG: hypothetical protein R3C68_10125 [Myxococcota bacterium]
MPRQGRFEAFSATVTAYYQWGEDLGEVAQVPIVAGTCEDL